VLEKYAVTIGGGWNHRMGLFDRILIKDNHLVARNAKKGKALTDIIQNSKKAHPDVLIEVEIDDLDQLEAAIAGEPDVILLDNFAIEELREALKIIAQKVRTEASGGVCLETLPALASIGLDFISCGALTHHATWVDIGLDF
jgi:nicotinate-nucleotide pyrophosphorylase (carboxylating)